MKNERIIGSWNKIGPDAATEARMLDSILVRTQSGQFEKGKVFNMNKALNRKRLAPLAACLAVVVALVVVFGNTAGWFGGKTLTADLGDGTLNFHKSDAVGAASLAWDADWGDIIDREFTADERKVLFGDLPVAGNAIFRSSDGAFMHFEGITGDVKIILSAKGYTLTDTIVEGNEEVSDIHGVPVTAGYFLTKANSQGVKTLIYFASWNLGDVTEYVELAGSEADSESLRNKLAATIEQLIQNGAPDMSLVTD
jgi:hypothetical protein